MAADDLAPYVTMSSTTMASIVQHKQFVVFQNEQIQLQTASQCREMNENVNIFLCFAK